MCMKQRAHLLLGLAVLFIAAAAPAFAQAAVEKAVYYDDAYLQPGGWIDPTAAATIRDFFVGKGYKELNAADLATFMRARIQDGKRSVIVFAKDTGPDTVCEAVEGGGPSPNTTLRQYLNAGGRIVWAGDIPFYYQNAAGTSTTWADGGSTTILGFNAAGGTWDLNNTAQLTDAGKRWGLSTTWSSVRPASAAAVDEVLASATQGQASGWVKRFVPGDNFGGFVRIIDHGLSQVTDDDMANMLAVAEYMPAGGPAALSKISGTVKDDAGKPVANAVILVSGGPAGTMSTTTDANGHYVLYTVPGTYTVVPEALASAPQTVTVDAAGATVDFTGKPLPEMSLGTADGLQWKILRAGSIFDFTPADPGYKLDSQWQDNDIPSDAEVRDLNGAYFWYHTTFTIPAEWGSYKRGLILDRYSVEDSDWSFFNGHFIGNNKWNTTGARRYFIPMDWVNFGGTNTLVVKGQHGNDTGGMNRAAPLLHFASPLVGAILVSAKEAGSNMPALNATVTLSTPTGDPKGSAVVREAGYAIFGEVPAGDYVVALQPTPAVANATPLTQTVSVKPGSVAEVTFNPTLVPLVVGDTTQYDDDFSGSSLASKWTSIEIGDAGGSSAKVASGELVVSAAGANIYDAADNFHFVYQRVSGDFSASVKVTFVPYAATLSKAALMIRANTDPDSVNALVYQSPTDNQQYGCRFQWRPTKGATTQGGTVGLDQPGTVAPTWLNIRRVGKTVTAYFSENGTTASLVADGANVTINDLPDTVLVGMGWASRGDMADARFDDFKIRPISAAPPIVKGDLSGDGKVLVNDAVLALQIAVGIKTANQQQLAAGDLNGDGKITINEVTMVLQAAVGLRQL